MNLCSPLFRDIMPRVEKLHSFLFRRLIERRSPWRDVTLDLVGGPRIVLIRALLILSLRQCSLHMMMHVLMVEMSNHLSFSSYALMYHRRGDISSDSQLWGCSLSWLRPKIQIYS
jgi:hypothetical protein